MASARSPRRNPYRPGTPSYERLRRAELNRRLALAKSTAGRAIDPEKRDKSLRRAATARRGLRQIDQRAAFRSTLSPSGRAIFDRFPLKEQDRELHVRREYPNGVPRDVPDPLAGPHRDALWRIYYSSGSRAGDRLRL
jgi:hypothetical protein